MSFPLVGSTTRRESFLKTVPGQAGMTKRPLSCLLTCGLLSKYFLIADFRKCFTQNLFLNIFPCNKEGISVGCTYLSAISRGLEFYRFLHQRRTEADSIGARLTPTSRESEEVWNIIESLIKDAISPFFIRCSFHHKIVIV
jgi:hypothetical protein